MPNDETAVPRPQAIALKMKRWLFIAGVVAIVLAAAGMISRGIKAARLAELTTEQSIATVEVVLPSSGKGAQELVLPGDIAAFTEAQIRARVNGYIREWKYDIGAHVKAGETLATIDAPELEQQLQQAKDEQAKAEANVQLAKLTSKRWAALRASTAVSQQSVDEKSGDFNAKMAEAAAARANVERLKALQGFTRVTAPFSGVVTQRNIDLGVLVGPGDNRELFDLADIHVVRVFVRAPQAFVAQLHIGANATLKLPQFPNRIFAARLNSTSNAIAEKSRTLLAQLLAINADGALLPGAYAEVHFKLPADARLPRVPANAILYRDNGLNVATVGADRKVAIKPIEVARDLGVEIEVLSGISTTDRIIVNPSDIIANGDIVRLSGEDSASVSSDAKKTKVE